MVVGQCILILWFFHIIINIFILRFNSPIGGLGIKTRWFSVRERDGPLKVPKLAAGSPIGSTATDHFKPRYWSLEAPLQTAGSPVEVLNKTKKTHKTKLRLIMVSFRSRTPVSWVEVLHWLPTSLLFTYIPTIIIMHSENENKKPLNLWPFGLLWYSYSV